MSNKKRIQVISFQSLSANSGTGMARLGYFLSRELDKRGLLKNFIVHSKGKFDTSFATIPVSPLSRIYLRILNRWHKRLGIPNHRFRLMQEVIFDWFCRFKIDKDADIIFTTNAYLKRTFEKARKAGILIILLPGTPEENYIYDLVTEENKKLKIETVDAYTYKKRIAFFNSSVVYADKVIGSLPTVYTSYTNSKVFKGEVVKILGHMTPDFAPQPIVYKKDAKDTYKVGYLAHTVILKGLQYLMQAWEELMEDPANHNMVLYIGGELEVPLMQYIEQHYNGLKNVEMTGHVSNVSDFMQTLDLFVVPSLIDGGPVTALEAAHNTVPVIITDNCGSSELLSRGDGGCWTVPIRDAAALKERILYAYQHQEEALQTGRNAKAIMDNYSMENFISEVADYLEHKV